MLAGTAARRWPREGGWLAGLLMVALALGPLHPWMGRTVYAADRTVMAQLTELQAAEAGDGVVRDGHAVVYYPSGARSQAQAVAAIAAWALPQVARLVGFAPPAQAVLVVERSEQALRAAMGWGSAEEALGVYWNGVVRVLSPVEEELPGPPG